MTGPALATRWRMDPRVPPWCWRESGRPLFQAVLLAALCLAITSPGAGAASQGRGAAYFPNTPLVTHQGHSVRFYDDLVAGKVVAINFIFTSCPDSCPAETAKLQRVREELGDRVGDDIFMYSISIDPDHDTPEVLAEYRKKFGIGPGWTFLTGSEDEIIHFRKRLGLYMEEIQNEDRNHNVTFIVGNDRTGKWVKRSPFDNPKALANLIGYELFDGQIARKDARSYSQVPKAPEYSRGEYLFRTRCDSCHTLGGGTTRLGPDLLGVTDRRERSWLARWIREPDAMLREGDPIATELYARFREIPMPNLRLEEADVDALIEHIARESRRLAHSPEQAAAGQLIDSAPAGPET